MARIINTAFAVALAAFVLINYWPIVKVFDLARADLQYQGEWIGGHARKITAVTPGGAADRAGLKAGDVLEFDSGRDSDWVLAGYRNMPEGFSATLPVRRADGTRAIVTLAPGRVAYLPTLNDRLALVARLCSLTLLMLIGVFMVWARPSLMTWSLLFGLAAAAPFRVWVPFYLAFDAGTAFSLRALIASSNWAWAVALVIFAMCFPRDDLAGWPRWQRWLGLALLLSVVVCLTLGLYPVPFFRALEQSGMPQVYAGIASLCALTGVAALARTYRRSGHEDRARLKWAIMGISVSWVGMLVSYFIAVGRSIVPNALGGGAVTPTHWIATLSSLLMGFSIGYAVVRQRVVDVQFAISRTVVYGVVSTVVLMFLAVLHWLLGRMIEHSGFAFGVEGLAAVGLGLVLHRASHGINTTVDRVLFRKHHAAEERLRQVTTALPFASTQQSIAQAIVVEPARNLELASAALFYRESSEGPLNRVLAVGWGESHAATLDADSLLVRYLQAEHAALRLDDEQEWLPAGMPEGSQHPVLAIPIVTQHVLAAVVLYGSHVNHTLLDPDEIELLHALAKAAATSHSQLRIAMLMREMERQRTRIGELEASGAELRDLVRVRLSGPQGAG